MFSVMTIIKFQLSQKQGNPMNALITSHVINWLSGISGFHGGGDDTVTSLSFDNV
jgi:hypothetical protein